MAMPVHYEVDGRLATITLDPPEAMNAPDLRYASATATFGFQEARWGLFPISGSTVRLPRQVPYCQAMELLMLGELIDASTAHAVGLVNEVVEPDRLMDRARRVGERLCRN